MSKRVYVIMSLQMNLFVKACRLRMKSYRFPGYPFQVVSSSDLAVRKCRSFNRTISSETGFVYFYQELYLYSD